MTIRPEHIGLPDEETMSEEDGLVENHQYRDLRGMTVRHFDRVWLAEQEVLDYAAAGNDLDSDEAQERFCDSGVWLMGLDPGIASSVAALSVIGACPVSSCTGEPGHGELHPLVYFWAQAEHLPAIEEAARLAGVDLDGVSTPGLLVSTESELSRMRQFAHALVDAYRASAR